MYKEIALRFRRFIEAMSVNATDEEALSNIEAFPLWTVGKNYEKDERIRYNDTLYKVLQKHTSQEDWTPDVAVSLFTKLHKQDPQEEFPEWEQPSAENPYMKGDRVTFEGKHYESLIDGNVWSPSAYPQGWKEIE